MDGRSSNHRTLSGLEENLQVESLGHFFDERLIQLSDGQHRRVFTFSMVACHQTHDQNLVRQGHGKPIYSTNNPGVDSSRPLGRAEGFPHYQIFRAGTCGV